MVALQREARRSSLPEVTSQGPTHQTHPGKPATAAEKGKVSCLPEVVTGRSARLAAAQSP